MALRPQSVSVKAVFSCAVMKGLVLFWLWPLFTVVIWLSTHLKSCLSLFESVTSHREIRDHWGENLKLNFSNVVTTLNDSKPRAQTRFILSSKRCTVSFHTGQSFLSFFCFRFSVCQIFTYCQDVKPWPYKLLCVWEATYYSWKCILFTATKRTFDPLLPSNISNNFIVE